MARKGYSNKEQDQLQKLKLENKRLKKQISSLRKLVSRNDYQHYEDVKEMSETESVDKREELLNKWQCWDCKKGMLRYIPFSKMGIEHFIRKCDNCGKRTKSKEKKKDTDDSLKPENDT